MSGGVACAARDPRHGDEVSIDGVASATGLDLAASAGAAILGGAYASYRADHHVEHGAHRHTIRAAKVVQLAIAPKAPAVIVQLAKRPKLAFPARMPRQVSLISLGRDPLLLSTVIRN